MKKTIDNPCYHCYQGAVGYCYDYYCKYAYEDWSQDLDALEIEVPDDKEEAENDERGQDPADVG